MRLFPHRRKDADPVKDDINTRRAVLKEQRTRRGAKTRRRMATPPARLTPTAIPPDAVVFQRSLLDVPVAPEAIEPAFDNPESSTEDPLDIPPDFLRREQPETEEPTAEAPGAEPVLEALAAEEPAPATAPTDDLASLVGEQEAPAGDALGGDMLDLFREEKAASGDGNLASEVDDVSISDLLGDLSSITERLGVPKRAAIVKEVHIEPEAVDEAPEAAPEPELKIEKIVPIAVAVAPEPQPEPEAVVVVEEEDIDIDIGALLEPAPEPEPELPRPPLARTKLAQPRSLQKRGVDGGMMMHLLFLGLALTAGGAFGITRINRPGQAGAEQTDLSQIVLAVVTTPRPTVGPIGTKAPTPTPSPSPTVAVTPAPTPRVRDASIPAAFHDYKVEYGDSLTSISLGFGLCPDQVLWANNRDEDTPLIAGEYLTIPDGVGLVHKVKAGDTLSSIARMYNADITAITAVEGNQVSTSADLIPGTEIFIPDGIPQTALDLGSRALKKMTNASSAGYVWPFYGPVTTYYGEQRVGYVHNAIDIGGLGHYGASVNSIADGRVAFVGNDDLYGNNVIVIHPDGTRSRYAHFSNVYVSQGESVSRGQALGALGCSGDSTGTHLHFEVWKNDEPVDPLIYLP